MAIHLNQKCETCGGTGEAPGLKWRYTPRCPSCNGEKFWQIGLTMAQVDRAIKEATHFYGPDGTAEDLGSWDMVKERRIAAARRIAELEGEVFDLRDCLDAVKRIGA